MHKYFLTTYRQTKGKIHQKLSIFKKVTYIQTNFQIKKGPLVNLRDQKGTLSRATHPRTHLSTKYPPREKIMIESLALNQAFCFCLFVCLFFQFNFIYQFILYLLFLFFKYFV